MADHGIRGKQRAAIELALPPHAETLTSCDICAIPSEGHYRQAGIYEGMQRGLEPRRRGLCATLLLLTKGEGGPDDYSALARSFRWTSLLTEVKSHSQKDRFLIALHSPDGSRETGLPVSPPERRSAKLAFWVQQDTFSESGLSAKHAELRGFSAIFREKSQGFSAVETCWRRERDSLSKTLLSRRNLLISKHSRNAQYSKLGESLHAHCTRRGRDLNPRSEEHTSELQS